MQGAPPGMEAMFQNPEMMQNMSSMMANLTPKDMQRMSSMAGAFGGGGGGAPGEQRPATPSTHNPDPEAGTQLHRLCSVWPCTFTGADRHSTWGHTVQLHAQVRAACRRCRRT
jgi:hypothetical protein